MIERATVDCELEGAYIRKQHPQADEHDVLRAARLGSSYLWKTPHSTPRVYSPLNLGYASLLRFRSVPTIVTHCCFYGRRV